MTFGKVESDQERPVTAQHHWIVRICIFVNPYALHQEAVREGGPAVIIDGVMHGLRQLGHSREN
ncbi:hypothetical protein [Bradyrhizobium sp. AS23.2]|uniref:hypothetical protein n=1 Tax=Bradyrhizobium sp. AS23.2 TaxID=1680155 RepID=UPI0011614412|nr:hypothetical protein [Bradyrhizobium sp. AS23.2]